MADSFPARLPPVLRSRHVVVLPEQLDQLAFTASAVALASLALPNGRRPRS
jgi:hypothetical protein